MNRPHAFQPTVMILENRWLPTAAIYTNPVANALQAAYVAQAEQTDNPVVFLGDSITFNWGTSTRVAPGTSVFSSIFAPIGAANFGIVGDTTADLIARIDGGDLAGKPKVAVVMIGVNNLFIGQTPLQAATGVVGVVQAIEAASPKTTILLLGVLPTDYSAVNPKIQELDSMISVLGKTPNVVYENPGVQFLGANEAAQPNLLIDGVHPDQAGYILIANTIDTTVAHLLQEGEYVADRPIPTQPNSKAKAAPIVVPVPAPLSGVSDPTGADAGLFLPAITTTTTSTDPVTTLSTAKPKASPAELINVSTN